MTKPEHSRSGSRRRGGRSLLRQTRYISTAAMEEVLELGHPEIDVDHLLVGLLVTGGPSASCLLSAGVDLPSLRRAVREVEDAEARVLGVRVAAPPAVPSARALSRTGAVSFCDRALAIIRSAQQDEDDRALLRALLDDDGRRAERILVQAGVDVVELRARLAVPATVTILDLPVEVVDALGALGPAARRCSASMTHEVPVNADAVWALVSDPRRRPEWDAACVEVSPDGDGVLRLQYANRWRTRTVKVLTERTGPRSLLWRELWAGEDDVSAALHLAVTSVGAGSRLRVDVTTVLRTRRGRALRPVMQWAVASRVRWLGQSVARAAARSDG